MRVLGIETSCDETGIALYDSKQGLLAHALHSQIKIHAEYGGVVPELASRDHIRKTLPLVTEVLQQADCSKASIDAIAYTAGPGLMGALLVGACTGRSLAWGLGVPSLAVHHMEGHLLAPLLEDNPPSFPFVALLVSGGHTLLVAVEGVGQYQLLGESLDDAAGEAFDKTAKLLGLPYPGGPHLAKLAAQGNAKRFDFPRPMTNRPGLDFSFSGLKTCVANTIADAADDEQTRADIAASFQQAVVDTLVIKCRRALQATSMSCLIMAGGVSANQHLRQQLAAEGEKHHFSVNYPRHEFCTDNGAMIAYAGYLRLRAGEQDGLPIITRARWPMTELTAPEKANG